MSFSGAFDPSKHPRIASGQHGGGEFESEGGSGAAAQPVSAPGPAAPSAPAAPHVPGVSAAPGITAKPVTLKGAVNPAADDQQQGQQSIGHRLLRVGISSADDIAVVALNSVMARHPEWFEALRGLAKMASDELRDDDGRWVAAGGAAAGSAIGGGAAAAGVARLMQHARGAAFEQAKRSLAVTRQARAKNAARITRHVQAEARFRRNLSSEPRFLGTMERSLASRARRADQELQTHIAEHSVQLDTGSSAHGPNSDLMDLFPDVEQGTGHATEPTWITNDPGGEMRIQLHGAKLAETLADLRANGKRPRSVSVSGSTSTPKLSDFKRTAKLPRKVVWPDAAALAETIARRPAHFASHGIQTVGDASKFALSVPKSRLGRTLADIGLPKPRMVQRVSNQVVRNTSKTIPDHTRVIDGYPNALMRQVMADDVRADIKSRSRGWLAQEAPIATRRIATARVLARTDGGLAAVRRLSMLRIGGKAAVIGAGLIGAAAAGSAALGLLRTRPVEKLAKAADSTPPDPAQQVFDAGAEVEQPLAEKIADTFGRWARLPSSLLTNQSAGLHGLLASSMDKALAPLNDASKGGAAAEVPVVQQDGTGRNRIVGMSLDVGSDKVRTFSNNYRVKLAGQMADEQFKTLQVVLRDATLNGQAPAATARLLRQVIGLTPVQAGYVLSYRKALQTLDPNVLRRALRDGRYDKTVLKAITTKTALTEDQVNTMTDAYQRRALALRAMTIARTEGVGAANNGHALAVQEFTDDNPGYTVIKTWSSTHDDLTRPDHVAMDGQQVVGLYTPFVAPSGDRIMWPHDPNAPARQVVNCFSGDTIIQGRVLRVMRAEYVGPMREIITRSGARLTVTPKHPILTAKGFVAAGTLAKGGDVLRYDVHGDGPSTIAGDDYQKPARIEDVFESFSRTACLSVQLESKDLYGDAFPKNGHVDVVGASRELLLNLEAMVAQRDGKIVLVEPPVGEASVPGSRYRGAGVHADGSPPRCTVGGLDLPGDKNGVHLDRGPLECLRLGPASNVNASLTEVVSEGLSSEAALVRDLLQRHAPVVVVDEILEVRDFQHDGPIYDVETTQGWVVAGGIFSSNCRCTFAVALVSRTAAAHRGFSLVADSPLEDADEALA